MKRRIREKIETKNNTCTTRETKFYSKMYGQQSSTRMPIWVLIWSQLSETIALLGPSKVKSQTPLTFTTSLRIRSKYSSIMAVWHTQVYTAVGSVKNMSWINMTWPSLDTNMTSNVCLTMMTCITDDIQVGHLKLYAMKISHNFTDKTIIYLKD